MICIDVRLFVFIGIFFCVVFIFIFSVSFLVRSLLSFRFFKGRLLMLFIFIILFLLIGYLLMGIKVLFVVYVNSYFLIIIGIFYFIVVLYLFLFGFRYRRCVFV